MRRRMKLNGGEMIRPKDAPDVVDAGKREARGDLESTHVEEHRGEKEDYRASGFSVFRSECR